ncbi:MAG: hypothetical protein K6G40_02165 [Eubacterium sp.]|nr:hypothetical protein [Eubacterium sp.]
MGRAGGGGGGHSSGGGHSMGHTGGGHHIGGSSFGGGSRAGGGSSFGGSFRTSGSYNGPGMRRSPMGGPGMPPPRRNPGGPVIYGGPGCGGLGCGGTILLIFVIILVMSIAGSFISTGSSADSDSTTKSTIQREKIDSGNAYINDCVIDELGWFENVSKTESRLKEFWEDTGVQPYIIFKSYDSLLDSDSAKEAWAIEYYDENFTNENIFLFVYFAEEDTDNEVGYMAYANGLQTSSVMDSEAVEIFWNYLDRYWVTDMSTDDVMVNTFVKTGDTIMKVSATSEDVAMWAFIAIAIIAAGVIIVVLVNKKLKRDKEKAEEDQRILNTPIDDLADDDLTNKYL